MNELQSDLLEKRIASRKQLYRDTIRAASLGLLINGLLAVVKIIGGILGHSIALLSDALNSVGDAVSSGVVIFALTFAQRPPTEKHPYGHTRMEAVAATNVALLIIISTCLFAWEAIQQLSVQHAIPPMWTLWIAGANVVIKESLYHYKVHIYRKTRSLSILANAWDHRGDAFCSLTVLIGLFVIWWFGPDYIWADEVASLFVVAAIIWTASRLLYKGFSELLDSQAEDDLVAEIRKSAESHDQVVDVETLRVRKSGLELLVDIHIEVDGGLRVDEGHYIGHQVKDQLLLQFPNIKDVLVHIEPKNQI